LNLTPAYSAAALQLSYDYGCSTADFETRSNTSVASILHPKRRKFKDYPDPFKIVTFGRGAVIAASGKLRTFAESIVGEYPTDGFNIFSPPCATKINDVLRRDGYMLMQVITLCPKTSARHTITDFSPYGVTFRIFEFDDIHRLLYPLSGFDNALSRKTGEITDVLAVCAIKDNRVIAVAGASNDSELMWQIGIDVLPEFREMGLARALVSTITDEITALDKIPYYGLLFGNIASLNTAISCGYQPMFAEIIASK
jgi:hypothetical protein